MVPVRGRGHYLLASILLAVALVGVGITSSASGHVLPGGAFTDDDGNPHEGMIEAIAAAGITGGCDAESGLYCPVGPVTRAQMATFIARGFSLPAATQDYFSDDNGTAHEANINRIAEAGIAGGAAPGVYDPDGVVSRAQMGTFLARALNLDPSAVSHFLDVSGAHAGNIEAIAAAGITSGCDATGLYYCPTRRVRRDQMATFLGRALALTPTAEVLVRIVDGNGEPFPAGTGAVQACAGPGWPEPCAHYSVASDTDGDGSVLLLLEPDVVYAVTGLAANTGWPDPWISEDGTEFHFSAELTVKGSDLEEGTTFVVANLAEL